MPTPRIQLTTRWKLGFNYFLAAILREVAETGKVPNGEQELVAAARRSIHEHGAPVLSILWEAEQHLQRHVIDSIVKSFPEFSDHAAKGH